ncbi:uncharacterized protein [Porites lutea]|uniref:uncharacterized protein n=1 Tax=Porites lutea TaxID=51062 RepID=UPI003CC52DA4
MSLVHILVAVYFVSQPVATRGNGTNENNSQVIDNIKCGLMNISCAFGKVCKGGVCIDVGKNSTESEPTKMTYQEETDPTYEVIMDSTPSTTSRRQLKTDTTKSHSFITGNQEFAIAIVGFCVLFFNFCLISFCLGRMKRRRLAQLQHQRLQEATRSSQASQTGDWNAEQLNMGIDNFALNGELDAFSSDFTFPQVRLPPYDFSSAYHKPRPMEEGDTVEGELPNQVSIDVENIDEDPPPYNDQQFDHLNSPPSYDELLVVRSNVEESTS